jgi:energy-converting hydrogenase Eha subunit H
MKKMTQKEKITEIINILHLLTKRVKKIEVDILKASTKNKIVDDKEVATRVAYIKQRNGL